MQDIDFGKAYRKRPSFSVDKSAGTRGTRQRGPVQQENEKHSSWGGKITFGVCVFIVAFTVGLVFGMRVQKERFTSQVEENIGAEAVKTANTNPAATEQGVKAEVTSKDCQQGQAFDGELNKCVTKNEEKKKAENQPAYIILGKVFPDKKLAYKSGLSLKKQGLPVFLAESGNRMKLYVGPVKGKTSAYNMLARVKKIPEFRGAILYKK